MSDVADKVTEKVEESLKDKALEYVKKVPWWGWGLAITGAYLLFRSPSNEKTEE